MVPDPTLPGLVADLVAARHAGGYRFTVQERVLRQFVEHCRREGYADGSITKEAVEGFLYGAHLRSSTIRRNELALRQLTEYARAVGWHAYIPAAATRGLGDPEPGTVQHAEQHRVDQRLVRIARHRLGVDRGEQAAHLVVGEHVRRLMVDPDTHANRRLLRVQRLSYDPITGTDTLTAVTAAHTTATGAWVPGLRLADQRSHALLSALRMFRQQPHGFTNRDLRAVTTELRGLNPGAVSAGQTTYDLRRLHIHGLITRIPHTHRYRVTDPGLDTAKFLTCVHDHVLCAGLAELATPYPYPADSKQPPPPTETPSTASPPQHNSPPHPQNLTTTHELDSEFRLRRS